jgi:signal recognition particle receptor subunit beta
MVSLETETDRTLFFDLLPIDVGSIAGFHTRIQLYTVPGQVFYNTTRKLVLKGVDGVVFVADSQRPMLQANVESLRNLEENLAEIGLSIEDIPVVLQYNKRDLPDICTVDELNQALNQNGWPYHEASAIEGGGVFETLKAVSKMTLIALKRRLAKGASAAAAAATPPAPVPADAQPAPAAAPAAVASPPATGGQPEATSPAAAVVAGPAQPADAIERAEVAVPAPPPTAAPSAAAPATAKSAAQPAARKQIDVLAELEKIRRQALGATEATAREVSPNGQEQISRDIQLTVTRADFMRARRFSLSLKVEDNDNNVVDAVRDEVEIDDISSMRKVVLRLNIALNPEE